MRALLASLILAVAACITPSERTSAERSAAEGQSRPVVVLLRHSVWFGSIDRPLFILYDDGTAIFPKTRDEWVPASYQSSRVDLHDRTSALASLGIGPAFFGLKSRYDLAPNVTDQETVFLLVWRGDSLTQVAVRAGVRDEGEFVAGVPQVFRDAYQTLSHFEDASATPWEPSELLVSAWPYEYAPDNPPLPWPSDWPDLTSHGSECHSDAAVREMCTLRLGAAYRTALEQLLSKRRQKQAIGIGGRKMAVGYRIIFPGEDLWRRALGRLEM